MLGKVSKVRHLIVGAAIAGTTVLTAVGVIGGGQHPERFDAKTVVVEPAGGDALRVTEYVDIDFGDEDRRGYLRQIPNDFGVPTDVEASSPDAADDLQVTDFGEYTEIRVGDPDRTFTGQHRYVVSYTYPDAMLDELGLDLDIVFPPGGIYPGDQETGRFEVVVTGFELDQPRCDTGGLGDTGGCELARDAGDPPVYRAVVEPLPEDEGLSVGGDIVEVTEPAEIAAPPIPERRGDPNRLPAAAGIGALGLLGAVPVYRWARRKGANVVYAGGAADAAYGDLPPPGTDPDDPDDAPPTMRVPDDELGDLATIEFVPPKGIEPWEASALITEQLGDDAVEAWIAGLVGKEAIEVAERDGELEIRSGPRRGELDAEDKALLAGILGISDPYVTGEYDERFAAAWKRIHDAQVRRIATSGWWKHTPPGAGLGPRSSGSPFGIIAVIVFVLIWSGSALTAFIGLLRSWPAAIVVGLLFPALVAYVVYRTLLPVRSAVGSALALRSESFRRFLHASEGRHVEWAWSHGLLREYSAWAVALGEADAWSDALDAAEVPAPAYAFAAPILLHHHAMAMRTARVQPSSSGGGGFGGGGGGFGGGGVGGGGGGGSSGSW